MRPRNRDEFEIAIVCALPREADAVRAMFDETLSVSYGKAPGDANSYTTGKMGQHYVVLAHMPGRGKGKAAAVATSLGMSYVGIQLVLLVGVCGGLPFTKQQTEIILGDVVLSKGVLEYDLGKRYPDGFKRLDNTLHQPPPKIRSVLANLATDESRWTLEEQLLRFLEHAKKRPGNKARYPGTAEDRLFEASYRHQHYRSDPASPCTCDKSISSRDPVCSKAIMEDCSMLGCDGTLIPRNRLKSTNPPEPLVHIGLVASGDTVMKSGIDRDHIAQKDGVIAFEMEGAGVWDTLSCLVVKGVCDYADSHKNETWQHYAAATAAAVAKALLHFWIPTTTVKRRFNIPFPRNDIFVGREAELLQLERGLFHDDRFSKMALHALGGMGKSSIALELVYRMRAKHPEYSIFWVNATSAETMEQSYREISVKLGLPLKDKADVMVAVKTHLSNVTAGRWFMILDNADNLEAWYTSPRGSRLADHVPFSNYGCVLLTTRTRQIAIKFAPRSMVGIEEMDFEKSSQLLGNTLWEKSLLDKVDKTRLLLETLCFLPLAIIQAAAYINMNDTTLDDYLSLLTDTEETLVETLSDDFEGDGRYQSQKNPVASTWLVSFEQIQNHKPLAAEYLAFISCIESKAIPSSLLPSPSNKEHIEAIGCLTSYSFLYKRVDDGLDMHRLVHLATRNWLSTNGKFQQCLEKATARLTSVFPEPDHEFRRVWRPMLPHVRYALRLNNGWNEKSDNLLHSYGTCLLSDGRYNDAQWSFEISVQGRKQARGAEHPDTLTSMAGLASTYWKQGRWVEAEKMQLKIMDTRKRVLGAEHPDALTSKADLASTYRKQGRWVEAEKLDVQVMDTRKRVLGAKHPDTLITIGNLALTYRKQGRWVEAEKLEVQVLDTRKRVLGAEHPDTLISMANLASTYRNQGRWVEAERLFVQVMETRKRVLRAEHPSTLTSMANLGLTYWNQGRWVEAEKVFVQVMGTRKRVLGTEHPDTLISMADLASTYRKQGRWEEAEELFVQVMETRKRVLGAEHPDTLAIMANLASTYRKQGRWQEAEKLQMQAMETSLRVLGAEHPDTLTSKANLAWIYSNQGRQNEAEKLQIQIMETRKRVLGAEHPDTLTSMRNLACTLYVQGRQSDAAGLMASCVERSIRIKGAEHPDTKFGVQKLDTWRASQAEEREASVS